MTCKLINIQIKLKKEREGFIWLRVAIRGNSKIFEKKICFGKKPAVFYTKLHTVFLCFFVRRKGFLLAFCLVTFYFGDSHD